MNERVYHRGEGWEFFYMYTTVLLDLGVRFPFSEFECGVLNQLKCAPTQIHPNAWAFIRGFEVLMEYVGQKPLLEVFFTFFQAKGIRKGGLVTLNSVQGKTLFGLYKQSYKDFKQMFVRVGCVEEQFPFYLDEYGLERFPLYWYSEPVQILGMSKVNRQSAVVIKFLEQHLLSKETLSLGMLLKWEKEREYVERYLGRGRCYGKKRVPSMKRRRAEEGGSGKKVIDLTSTKCCGKEVSLEEVKEFAEKQKRLHGYAGEEDLTAVWSEHFPYSFLAEEHFQSKFDFDLIGSVDGVTRAQFMQVCVARLFCMGRYEELRVREETEQEKEKVVEVQRALEAERKLEVASEQLAVKEKEVLELKADIKSLKRKFQKLDKDKTDLEARVAEYFYPDLKFDKLDPIKVVHNGALVDDDEVEVTTMLRSRVAIT
ncbi:hypothetical protein PIB30_015038 [Stylosanthes scabra]|uniref:Transposase (putative) gypsy type domain-containing protein n=1 Tax=Stylosanthes scabra TaxID=79078 RepID=A0ABU6Z3E3_9FABA|nr:hypothetical protein [Stylosanthes scabra]